MRIVKLDEFLTLPAWTLYTDDRPSQNGEMKIKTNDPLDGYAESSSWVALNLDWIEAWDGNELHEKIGEMMADPSVSFPFDDESTSRRGAYDYSAEASTLIFTVYEKADLVKLRGCLDAAIANAPS